MECYKRKPDYEDEYIRAWKVDKNKEEVKKVEELETIRIKHREQEFGLCGFSKVLDKKTGKVLFYYKVKKDEENWIMLYYVVDDSRKIEIMGILNEYKKTAEQAEKMLPRKVGFEVKDVRIYLNDALESNVMKEE